jgi:hypothetical protein
MADPIDPLAGVLDPPAPVVPDTPDPAAQLAEAQAEAERQRLLNEGLQAQLQANGQHLNDLREQMARSQAPAPQNQPDLSDPNAEYWTDPTAFTDKRIEQAIQARVAPQASGINAKLGQIAIQNFLASKTGDPFFAAVSPIFNDQLKGLPRETLGSQPEAAIQHTLDLAWNASVGSYVQTERTKRAAAAPANLGGGGQAGGGTPAKKTLAEIDPVAYNMALSAGQTPEQIQAIADSLQEEE